MQRQPGDQQNHGHHCRRHPSQQTGAAVGIPGKSLFGFPSSFFSFPDDLPLSAELVFPLVVHYIILKIMKCKLSISIQRIWRFLAFYTKKKAATGDFYKGDTHRRRYIAICSGNAGSVSPGETQQETT